MNTDKRIVRWPVASGQAQGQGAKCRVKTSDGGEYVGGLERASESGQQVFQGKGKLRFGRAVDDEAFAPEWCAGMFVNGKLHGVGVLVAKQGVYSGSFMNGLLEGNGKYQDKLDGSVISGEFRYGQPHGFATCAFPNGDAFRGKFHDGVPVGVGAYDVKNGTEYEGQMGEGGADGLGIMQTADGTMRYTGEFKDNKLHGLGLQQFSNGDIYKGKFEDGRIHGRGMFQFPNDDSCSGNFVDGALDGEGEFNFASGDKYKGHFKQGVMHGPGVMSWLQDNTTFKGQFKDGKVNGSGKLIQRRPRKESRDNATKLYSLDGCFEEGKPNGEMSFENAHQTAKQVLYKDGVLQNQEEEDNVKEEDVVAAAVVTYPGPGNYYDTVQQMKQQQQLLQQHHQQQQQQQQQQYLQNAYLKLAAQASTPAHLYQQLGVSHQSNPYLSTSPIAPQAISKNQIQQLDMLRQQNPATNPLLMQPNFWANNAIDPLKEQQIQRLAQPMLNVTEEQPQQQQQRQQQS